jgi:hypothetical protein
MGVARAARAALAQTDNSPGAAACSGRPGPATATVRVKPRRALTLFSRNKRPERPFGTTCSHSVSGTTFDHVPFAHAEPPGRGAGEHGTRVLLLRNSVRTAPPTQTGLSGIDPPKDSRRVAILCRRMFTSISRFLGARRSAHEMVDGFRTTWPHAGCTAIRPNLRDVFQHRGWLDLVLRTPNLIGGPTRWKTCFPSFRRRWPGSRQSSPDR